MKSAVIEQTPDEEISSKSWAEILEDFCWIHEWAERFPNGQEGLALAWAKSEIARIGKAIDALPEEHKIRRPDIREHGAALEIIQES